MGHGMRDTLGSPGYGTNGCNRCGARTSRFEQGTTIQSRHRGFDDFFWGNDFPGSGGAIWSASRTHRKILFFTFLSVTRETRTHAEPSAIVLLFDRRGQSWRGDRLRVVKEYPLMRDTSFHAKPIEKS